jgi:type IV secretory pathway TrbD component
MEEETKESHDEKAISPRANADRPIRLRRGSSAARISIRDINYTSHDEPSSVNARRSGSSSVLARNPTGELIVERQLSRSDISIAFRRRVSGSSLPNVLPFREPPSAEPVKNAADALERIGGKGAAGAYSEHMFPLEVLADKYFTHIDIEDPSKSKGLTEKKADEVYDEYGPNMLTPPPKVPLWLLFLLQFANLLMVLMMITGTLCIILFLVTWIYFNLYIGVLLWIVVIVTCYETYSQEAKSDTLMEQFRSLVPESASVIRDGVMKPIDSSEIVIGDIIRLKAGDKVPADCRVIYNQSMKVRELSSFFFPCYFFLTILFVLG